MRVLHTAGGYLVHSENLVTHLPERNEGCALRLQPSSLFPLKSSLPVPHLPARPVLWETRSNVLPHSFVSFHLALASAFCFP